MSARETQYLYSWNQIPPLKSAKALQNDKVKTKRLATIVEELIHIRYVLKTQSSWKESKFKLTNDEKHIVQSIEEALHKLPFDTPTGAYDDPDYHNPKKSVSYSNVCRYLNAKYNVRVTFHHTGRYTWRIE